MVAPDVSSPIAVTGEALAAESRATLGSGRFSGLEVVIYPDQGVASVNELVIPAGAPVPA